MSLQDNTKEWNSHGSIKASFSILALRYLPNDNDKKGISAKKIQRQLGHKRYEPIWLMMHKIRIMMGIRDDNYELEGVVELDDAFIKIHSDKKSESPTKRGGGNQRKSKELVMAKVEHKQGRPRKNKKPSAFRYVKMVFIPNFSAETMNTKVANSTIPEVIVKSDGRRGLNPIKEVAAKHIKKITPPKEASKTLPWVHPMISNAKRKFSGNQSPDKRSISSKLP